MSTFRAPPMERRQSSGTLCSSNSSCVLQKRKPLHPLATSLRPKYSHNSVSQRVLSAKVLRFKTLQNQLNDANFHIAQLVEENKLLKNLQKRQDHALSKYEGANAQLPQVLESHQEELRILQAKNKTLKKSLKELQDRLRNREDEILSLKDENKHLHTLSKNKNLEEREKLNEKVEELNARLRQNETTISVLNRKLLLESKNCKFKLMTEMAKHKQLQRDLIRAQDQLQAVLSKPPPETKDKSYNRKTFSKAGKCISIGNLSECKSTKSSMLSKKPSTTNTSDSFTSYSEETPVKDFSKIKIVKEGSSNSLEKESSSSHSVDGLDHESNSEDQLKEMVNIWQKKNSKMEEELDKDVKKYASEIIADVKESNNAIDQHTIKYRKSLETTDILIDSLKETDLKHAKLNSLKNSETAMTFYDYTFLKNKGANDDLVNQMLTADQNFNYSFEENLLIENTSKMSITEPNVNKIDKQTLLAQLKAIDNGEEKVVVSDLDRAKSDLMKHLFGPS